MHLFSHPQTQEQGPYSSLPDRVPRTVHFLAIHHWQALRVFPKAITYIAVLCCRPHGGNYSDYPFATEGMKPVAQNIPVSL